MINGLLERELDKIFDIDYSPMPDVFPDYIENDPSLLTWRGYLNFMKEVLALQLP
ncbi:MAG: hypothetical protein AABW91_03055 [Nanoarchaeota archaeon]